MLAGGSVGPIRAALAQLVERHFCKVDVVSSNLTGGSNGVNAAAVALVP